MSHNPINTPLFSILIAQYNNGKYFEDCYKSIMAQTYSHWETIIVDDCSTDESVQQMKTLIGDDIRFKIFINEENRGCGFTKRKCAELASGEICGFVDPDDAITETAIEEMVIKHLELPDVGLVYSNFIYCDENLEPKKIHFQKKIENFAVNFFNFGPVISHFATFKNSFYKETTGIDPYLMRAVDQDLYLKLYEVGKVYYINSCFYNYRVHNNGISNKTNARKAQFWHWVVIIDAGKRRNYNLEDIYLQSIPITVRQRDLEKEISSYNKSFIFKFLRKIGLFRF